MTVRVRVSQMCPPIAGNLTLKCVGTLITCSYMAGVRSRRGSPKAGTTVMLASPTPWPEQLCSSFSLPRLHWRAPMTMARMGGEGHPSPGWRLSASRTIRSSRFISACRITLFVSCLQKSSFGYLKTPSAFVICHETEPLVFRLQAGLA